MPTLEEAEVAFSQWRSLKTSKYERIPPNLMEMARTLVTEHGVVAVSRRLRVSSRRFQPKGTVTLRPTAFVEMARAADLLSPSIIVNLKLASKKELTVTIPAGDIAAVSDLLKKMSKL